MKGVLSECTSPVHTKILGRTVSESEELSQVFSRLSQVGKLNQEEITIRTTTRTK